MKVVDLDIAIGKTLNQLLDETICRQLKLELHNLSVYMVDSLLGEDTGHNIGDCNKRIEILKNEIVQRNIAKGLVIAELDRIVGEY